MKGCLLLWAITFVNEPSCQITLVFGQVTVVTVVHRPDHCSVRWVPESVACFQMVFNKKRTSERAQHEQAKLVCAIALVGLLSPALAAEVAAGVVQVVVVPYHSREDLRKRGYVVDGSVFADFDKFRDDNNPYFIRPDLIFSTPTICVSVESGANGELDATLELVYWPDLKLDTENHFNVLHLIRLISSPLPETQYRHRQGECSHS